MADEQRQRTFSGADLAQEFADLAGDIDEAGTGCLHSQQ
jgi:hypothetical protein